MAVQHNLVFAAEASSIHDVAQISRSAENCGLQAPCTWRTATLLDTIRSVYAEQNSVRDSSTADLARSKLNNLQDYLKAHLIISQLLLELGSFLAVARSLLHSSCDVL